MIQRVHAVPDGALADWHVTCFKDAKLNAISCFLITQSFSRNNTSMIHHRTRPDLNMPSRIAGSLLIAVCLLGGLEGCTREVPIDYGLRDATAQLPSHQKTSLHDALRRYFGTPFSPRFKHNATVSEQRESSSSSPAPDTDMGTLADFIARGQLAHGQRVYAKQCQACHGVDGNGNGPVAYALNPKPRNYQEAKFKFASTPRGYKPRRDDLIRIIRRGAKGTSMPAFRLMPDEDVKAVVDYVMALTSRGELEKRLLLDAEDLDEDEGFDPADVATHVDEIIASWQEAPQFLITPVVNRVPYSEESIQLGRKAFVKESCYKCHGVDGRGSGRRPLGKDDWGHDAFAANLAAGMLHGGRRPLDIYRRIHGGINGTPMPGYLDALKDRPETMWHLANFITSIVEGAEIPEEELKQLAAEAQQLEAEAARGNQTPAAEGDSADKPEADSE
jgi:mono/diheme cytochrome c family protein